MVLSVALPNTLTGLRRFLKYSTRTVKSSCDKRWLSWESEAISASYSHDSRNSGEWEKDGIASPHRPLSMDG
jgi:hypothetical protein